MELKWVVVLISVLGAVYTIPWDEVTPLDEYVHSDDGYYSWDLVAEYRYNSCSLYVVNMTAQKYQNESFINHPIWWHFVGVAVPDPENLTHPDAGFMFINGGGTDPDDSPPDRDALENVAICLGAVDMGAIGGYIRSVPNQPVVFANDPTQRERSEDSIIAWTWRTFIDNPTADPSIILRMPMTKSAKRGLDAINEVAVSLGGNPAITEVNRFMVLGASKRGWTTWSLAATDQRVIAIAPLVFSMLNFNQTLMSHFRAMGGAWSFAFESYHRENLTQDLMTDRAKEAFMVEDMWEYRERLTLPILQMVATGDEFFLCQDSHHWWNDIPDPKWTYMMENAEHAMFPHYFRIYDNLVSFYGSILQEVPLPQVTWSFGEEADGLGFIEAESNVVPEFVTSYRAVTLVNDTRRDFRLAEGSSEDGIIFHPVIWEDYFNFTEISPNKWRATAIPVDDEWTGFLIRFLFRGPDGNRLFFTTETNIVPDVFPVGPCNDPASCFGAIV